MQERCEGAEKKRTLSKFRAPVVCVLSHVDTGKLRGTNVQGGEANGITQQIGATNVPIQAIREASKIIASFQDLILKVPGLVIIDTPGLESFINLMRSELRSALSRIQLEERGVYVRSYFGSF